MRKVCFAAIWMLMAGLAMAQSSVRMPDGETAAVNRSGAAAQAQLKSGLKLIGVDMSWYTPAKPDPQPLSDDDRAQIKEILTVPSFYDRTVLLKLAGDSQRAVGLMELIRDRDFHAGKGEVIWRAELWYFEFENGGWAKVSQQNKVLDRQRFASADDYAAFVSNIRFVPKLGTPGPATQPGELALSPEDIISPSVVKR
jgi:hypothetical protein